LNRYHTRLIVRDEALSGEFARGRGWSAHLEPDTIRTPHPAEGEIREIVLLAGSLKLAQHARDLIFGAQCLLGGTYPMFGRWGVLPADESEQKLLQDDEVAELRHLYLDTNSNALAANVAAVASQRRYRQYALAKNLLSHFIATVHHMDLNPSHWSTGRAIQDSPETHVAYAHAIVAAYAAIEEIGLEVRANKDRPSRLGGKWNPPVLAELETRLRAGGVDPDETVVWTLRHTPTRIERTRRSQGEKAPWSAAQIRDQLVPITDAIAYVAWLRSKVSAHRLGDLAPSLTIYDVHNAQATARRLLLGHLGFWHRHRPRRDA
jgi:hypothetical protein